MDLTTATPAEIDAELARLSNAYAKLAEQRDSVANTAHQLNSERAVYKGRRRVYTKPLDDTLAELETKLSENKILPYEIGDVREMFARFAAIDMAMEANQSATQQIDIEYARRPWSRFIAVDNGHVHSGRHCAKGTIRVTTKIGWHPELSGKTEAEAVELLGPMLCTHCFPSAPVEWTVGTTAKKKVAEGYCGGQGEQGIDLQMQYASPRGTCPKCKRGASVSKTGKVLRHKLPEA